jgi:two-component system, chemotaxis family, response regulator Rcp1
MEILIVEDSPSDVFITKEAFKLTNGGHHIHVAHDGVEAMEFLRKEGKHSHAPCPDIVLLDLNMPRKDGREVLGEMKNDQKLRCIPVIVMTSSGAERDVDEAYSLHANCYVTKPADFDQFKDLIKTIQTFWFSKATLPTRKKM